MTADEPQTPDIDLPGQPRVEADLDIVVEPEADGAEGESGTDATSDEADIAGASADDPALGNTLIRPENS